VKSLDITRETRFALSYLEALDCSLSLTAAILLRYKEYEQLVKLEFNPLHFNSVKDAADALAAVKFLSKNTFLRIDGLDTKSKAMDSFFEAERVCSRINSTLSSTIRKDSRLAAILSIAARKIDILLGDIEIKKLFNEAGWGPGATYSLSRRSCNVTNKFRSECGMTFHANDLFGNLIPLAYPLWAPKVKIQPGNRVVTVPKNAKTDRTIAIEPGLNLWFQKAVGSILRSKLKSVGIDLDDQRHNQRLSRIGSLFNKLATVDLSMASDTISSRLVEELLPRNWFHLLDSLRSKSGRISTSHIIHYEKFSSMGNGFTFELETLIFWAISCAVCEYSGEDPQSVSVYGDDIIIPSRCVDMLSSIFLSIGFTVNKSKSYSSTYYRESCGKHYWFGADISPIFLKERIQDEKSILKTANLLRRYAHRRNTYGCDIRFRKAWQFLRSLLSPNLDLKIPDGYGDGGLVVNFDECTPPRARHGYEGFFVKCWTSQVRKTTVDDDSLLLASLYQLGISEEPYLAESTILSIISGYIPRENSDIVPAAHRYRRKRILVPQWNDLGPWC